MYGQSFEKVILSFKFKKATSIMAFHTVRIVYTEIILNIY